MRHDVVAGQGLLVFLVDQPDGLVAAVSPQQQRFEYHVRVIELDQGIEVATVVRGESGPDKLHVLPRHRLRSISALTRT